MSYSSGDAAGLRARVIIWQKETLIIASEPTFRAILDLQVPVHVNLENLGYGQRALL